MHPEICCGPQPPCTGRTTAFGSARRRSVALSTALITTALSAGPAQALSACESPVFACDLAASHKQVQVCEVQGKIRYEFGPPSGAAELVLLQPREKVKVEPWNGVGWDYWASLEMRNGAWSYRLSVTYPRGDPQALGKAGITVLRDGQAVRELACVPESVRERIETLVP